MSTASPAPQPVTTKRRQANRYRSCLGAACDARLAALARRPATHDGSIVPDPAGIITGGHDNQTARTVAVHQGERIDVPALGAMFRQIIANNRAGGWRKLKVTATDRA